MADHDTAGVDDELSLPKATVTKLINEMMPDDIACAKETRDLLMDCCVEFIHLISSEANEICEKESKKTIAAEHVISALQSLGFEGFVPEIQEVYREHKQSLKEREKKVTKFEASGLTEEELLRQQQEMFERAKLKYQQQQQQGGGSGANAGGQ